jgi:hypothetical protein
MKANWVFYLRNKLLLLIVTALVLVWGLFTFPSIFMISIRQKFEIIISLMLQTSWFINILVSALGMLNLSYNLNQRCYKMVVTKPCRPETWLLANFLSAMAAAVILHALLFACCSLLFMVWKIPYQWGLLYISFDGLARSAILFSVLTMLAALIHPFIAILFMLILSERTFYMFILWTSASIKNAAIPFQRFMLLIQKYVLYGVYIALPSYTPLSEKTDKIYQSLKVNISDLRYITGVAVYSLVISAVCYFITDISLKHRRLT